MPAVGIDLGTTFSVIATPQQFEGESFDHLCGVSVIRNRLRQSLTPSAVAVDARGRVHVGYGAKNQARTGNGPQPIMFVKRQMDQDITFSLGDEILGPEGVSAKILEYLKDMAEEQMGEPIEEAVITVPAYFNMKQRQKTKEAGLLAGLNVHELLLEPVAAALAYCYEDNRDPLRIMTYDLGGGTFDIAILERQGGLFDVKAFDGDRYLGGYNFDLRLAHHIADWINAQGYRGLDVDLEAPANHILRTRLMMIAEDAKIKLTDREDYVIYEENTGIQDDDGIPVVINMPIARREFEVLIADYIENTIQLCRRAMRKAGLTVGDPQSLDEIVMVGGSSYIPMVARRLEAEFGVPPRLLAPNLAVAIGAAIKARQLGTRVGPLKLEYIPATTPLPTLQIAGTVDTTDEWPDLTGSTVTVIPVDQTQARTGTVQDNGGFLIQRVPLEPDMANELTVRVEDARGHEVVTHQVVVQRVSSMVGVTESPGLPGNVLPKAVKIKTAAGLEVVAKEGTKLPFKCGMTARTTDQSGQVHIPIYEENVEIGRIVVLGVPTDLPVGSQVVISLDLLDDFSVRGRAFIPAANVEGTAEIDIPSVKIQPLNVLKGRYRELERHAEDVVRQLPRGEAMQVGAQLRDALDAAEKELFQERSPDAAKAQELLAGIETTLEDVGHWNPIPPPEQFEQVAEEIEYELLPALRQNRPNADIKGDEARLQVLRQMGKTALENHNEADWSEANRKLGNLYDRLVAEVEESERRARPPKEDREEPPQPQVIKFQLGMQLTDMGEKARQMAQKGRNKDQIAALEAEIEACEQALQAIDANAPNALVLLMQYYQGQHKPLESKFKTITSQPARQLSEHLVDQLELD
jgi:molecular chaperone DnaK (HSP70)